MSARVPPTVRVNRNTLLFGLAASGASIMFHASAHNVSREVFDSVRGEERPYNSEGRKWWSKTADCGGLYISLYTNEPPQEDDASDPPASAEDSA